MTFLEKIFLEKNTYTKIQETHTNDHAQKIRIVQVLTNEFDKLVGWFHFSIHLNISYFT